jgi:hypothetical protein
MGRCSGFLSFGERFGALFNAPVGALRRIDVTNTSPKDTFFLPAGQSRLSSADDQDHLGHRDPKHTFHYIRIARFRFEEFWGS